MSDHSAQFATGYEGGGRYRSTFEQAPVFFKGSSFTLTIAHITTPDLDRIERELSAKVSQAPNFFQDTALVLDLHAVEGHTLSLETLIKTLRAHGTHPIGVRNGDTDQQNASRSLGLAIFPAGRQEEARFSVATPTSQDSRVKPRIWNQPVRSGQQIYAAGGDLILLGMVNAGAEVLADGNIHCYAPLRGRALAGVKGNTEARIFTSCMEAELLSISGYYRIIEDVKELPPEIKGRLTQIYLSEERVIIEPL